MAPAILNEVPSATANGLDDLATRQDHLKDTRNELEALHGEPDKKNAVGRHDNGLGGSLPAVSANEDDPFDSDSDSDGDDDEFMPRGQKTDPSKAAPLKQGFVPTKAKDNLDSKSAAEGRDNVLTGAAAAPPGVRTGAPPSQPGAA